MVRRLLRWPRSSGMRSSTTVIPASRAAATARRVRSDTVSSGRSSVPSRSLATSSGRVHALTVAAITCPLELTHPSGRVRGW
jgi:hypothetical protein